MQNDSSRAPSAPLPPIPTPAATRLRELRVKYVPPIVFAVLVLLIWRLWATLPPATGIRGIGDGAVSWVTAPHDGFIEQMMVQPYQRVEAGEPLLAVAPYDPRSNLDLLQSRVQLARLAVEPTLADRNAIDYEQLRVAALRLKQELAMARANLERARKVLPRHEQLLNEKLISRDIYDLSVRDQDFYQAEVEEKTRALSDINERLQSLQTLVSPAETNSPIATAMAALQEQLVGMGTNVSPLVLQAPIAGQVQLQRQNGEFVRAGEPILVINSHRADRVVAYLRQPLPFEPQVGMPVEILTTSREPIRFTTQISEVGARLEPITNAVAYLQAGAIIDAGLPIVLPIPENISVRPGEVVQVALISKSGQGFFQHLFGRAN
jgi:multidrug resistance efflux pump